MNRLKTLLLTSAVVPALAFTPIADAFAQAPPDQHKGEPGRHPEGGGPGGGHEPRAGGGMRGPHAERGEGGPGGGAPRMQRGEGGAGGEHGGPRAQHGEGGPGGPGGPGMQRGEGGPGGERHGPRAQRGEGAPGGGPGMQRGEGGPGGERGGPGTRRGEGGPGGGPGMQRGEGGAGGEREGPRAQRGESGPGGEGGMQRGEGGPGAERGRPGAPPANAERAAPGGPGQAEGRPGRERGPGAGRDDTGRMGGPNDERGPRGAPGERRGPGRDAAGPGAGPGGPGGAPVGPGERRDDRMRGDRRDDRMRGDRGIGPGGVAAGVAAGAAAGFMAATGARRLDEIRRDRRETVIDGRTVIREPGREIVEDGGRRFVVHDENDRFRQLGYKVQRERRGADFVDVVDLPGGQQILTFTTPDGRLLRRVRRGRDGREIVLIDNGVDGRVRPVADDIVVLPPPPLRIPRDRYIVAYEGAGAGAIYDTLVAPPLAPLPRRYTLDQIRYSPDVLSYVRAVDIDTINFDTGSWIVPGDQTGKLRALADAINKAIDQNPNSVFLVEGYTDATGNPTDNLSLSDRRAQSVASILTQDFNVPPENLTTQGYGDQHPKENTPGPSAANRRVVVQNITQLLASGGAPPQ